MDFNALTIEELAMDDSFRNYCFKRNQADVSFWDSWCQQNPEKVQLIRDAKQLVLMLSGGHTAEELLKDKADFTALVTQHSDLKIPSKVKRFVLPTAYLFRAAAVVFIITTSILLYHLISNNHSTHISSNVGERKMHVLPDGTTVVLNAGSVISLAEDFNNLTREVVLEGEAFFDVKHDSDRPFLIRTPKMDIRVLGTVFNVKAYPGDNFTETSLIEGSVEVVVKESKEKVVLKPNEKIVLPQTMPVANQVSLNEPEFVVTHLTYDKVGILAEISWKENRIVFNEEEFEEVAKVLRRWYGREIVFKNEEVKTFRFTATFENKTIDQVMEALQLSRPFTYTLNQNQIIISQ